MTHPLRLTDDQFWTDPASTKDEIISELMSARSSALLIDLPSYVPLESRSTLPLAGVWVRTLQERLQIDLESSGLGVAVELDSNDFRVGAPFATGKNRPRTPPPERPPGRGFAGAFLEAELRDKLNLPWERSRWCVWLLLRERVSNPSAVELGPSMHAYQDPEVAAYLAKRRAAAALEPAPAVWPPLPRLPGAIGRALGGGPDPYPNYRQSPQSPPLPDTVGIALKLDRVVEPPPDRRAVLRGSFRLPVTERERVLFDPQTGVPQDVGVPGATAVVKIHLVATGAERVGPFVFGLRVPTYDALPVDGPAEATGFFNLDLFGLEAMPVRPGSYFFHAFSRDVQVGPVTLGIAPRTP